MINNSLISTATHLRAALDPLDKIEIILADTEGEPVKPDSRHYADTLIGFDLHDPYGNSLISVCTGQGPSVDHALAALIVRLLKSSAGAAILAEMGVTIATPKPGDPTPAFELNTIDRAEAWTVINALDFKARVEGQVDDIHKAARRKLGAYAGEDGREIRYSPIIASQSKGQTPKANTRSCHCIKCNWTGVRHYTYSSDGKAAQWANRPCPKCGGRVEPTNNGKA